MRNEPGRGTVELLRMPADSMGKHGYYQPGGVMAALAQAREADILRVAREDADRALSLITEPGASKYELIRALAYLVQSTRAAVDVAECRQERLDARD
ncbi:hypothetical protein [Streptomyces sp. DSM 118148]|uniref:hypothetical protein n=1 Tax=Streptomyces sp. DSM 118148 TaxID=3448667 RepID=UPI00403FE355